MLLISYIDWFDFRMLFALRMIEFDAIANGKAPWQVHPGLSRHVRVRNGTVGLIGVYFMFEALCHAAIALLTVWR